MVRPDLRRDIAGVPEISVPQERVDVGHPGGMSSSQGSTVLWNLVPKDQSEPRLSTRIFEEMRKRSWLCVRGGLEGGLASSGWQLKACWGGGNSL
jgi:hypothetical protein